MKKFLAIILVLMLTFSTLLITACNKDNTADTDTETSSTIEETSSTRKRGEGAGSGVTPTSSDDTPTSIDDDTQTSSDDGSGGNSSQTPSQGGDTSYSDYDYTYQTGVTEPAESTSPAGKLDLLLYLFASDFDKPTLTDNFYSTLADYEARYNALSAADKALVKNAPFLQEARTAYNNMAKQECEKLISALPEASIENIEEFSKQKTAIDKLIKNLGGEANAIPNKTSYDQKVAKIDSIYIDAFNQKVAEVRTFEYTPDYKAKLDNAMEFYNGLSASQQSAVNTSYKELSNLLVKYEDTGVVNEFNEVYSKLPAPSAVTKEDKTNIELARMLFGKMSNTQLLLLGNDKVIRENLNNLKTEINKICPEFVWARSLEKNKSNKKITFANSTLSYDFSGSSTNSGTSVFTYDGKPLTESFTFNAKSSFKMTGVPYGGKLVLYVTHYNSQQVNVTVSGGSHTETKELVANETLEFDIPSGGDYTITFSDKVKVFAVKFS